MLLQVQCNYTLAGNIYDIFSQENQFLTFNAIT